MTTFGTLETTPPLIEAKLRGCVDASVDTPVWVWALNRSGEL